MSDSKKKFKRHLTLSKHVKRVEIMSDDESINSDIIDSIDIYFSSETLLKNTINNLELGKTIKLGEECYYLDVNGDKLFFNLTSVPLTNKETNSDYFIIPFTIKLSDSSYNASPSELSKILDLLSVFNKPFIILFSGIDNIVNRSISNDDERIKIINHLSNVFYSNNSIHEELFKPGGLDLLRKYQYIMNSHFNNESNQIISHMNFILNIENDSLVTNKNDFIVNFILQILNTNKHTNYKYVFTS